MYSVQILTIKLWILEFLLLNCYYIREIWSKKVHFELFFCLFRTSFRVGWIRTSCTATPRSWSPTSGMCTPRAACQPAQRNRNSCLKTCPSCDVIQCVIKRGNNSLSLLREYKNLSTYHEFPRGNIVCILSSAVGFLDSSTGSATSEHDSPCQVFTVPFTQRMTFVHYFNRIFMFA